MRMLSVTIDGETFDLGLDRSCEFPMVYRITIDGREVEAIIPVDCVHLHEIDWLIVDGRPYEVSFDPELRWINGEHGQHQIHVRDLERMGTQPLSLGRSVRAPIPGIIHRVMVSTGQKVAAGQPLPALEAMKMQNEIRAPRTGVIQAIHVEAGRTVGLSEPLIDMD